MIDPVLATSLAAAAGAAAGAAGVTYMTRRRDTRPDPEPVCTTDRCRRREQCIIAYKDPNTPYDTWLKAQIAVDALYEADCSDIPPSFDKNAV